MCAMVLMYSIDNMRDFFIIVFGGLALMFIGIGIGKYAPSLITSLRSLGAHAASEIQAEIEPALRFTAQEEEDVIDAAAKSYPNGTSTAVTADHYIVRDITHDKIVFEKDADRLVPIASLVKLITAVVARQEIDMETHITVGPKVMSAYGNTAEFREGETFTARDLMYPLLMVSSNDAAEALARAHGRPEFIKLMNTFAQSIGAYETYIADPAGLSPDTVSSAGDMALVLEWIYIHDPDLLEITRLKTKTVRYHTWTNPTHFLNWSYYRGGKNGYIPESDRTSAGLFTLDDDKTVYAVVVLGSSFRDRDVVALLEKVKKEVAHK